MSLSKAIGVISSINECVNFFQWVKSTTSFLRHQRSDREEQNVQGEVLHLKSGLQRLKETLPAMYNLIDRAEWRSHELGVAELLPALKDAVYDADDLLDEYRWHELKMELEVNASQCPTDFFDSVVQGSFNKVDAIQQRLDNLSGQLEKMGLHEVAQRFDRFTRPETSSFPTEKKIFGRKKELEAVISLLGVPTSRPSNKRKRTSSAAFASTSNQVSIQDSDKAKIERIPVLPIVGIGGVGKTTLVQHISKHPQVTVYFDKIIWICVSDDFDVNRLIKEALKSLGRDDIKGDSLDILQNALRHEVERKRLLIILDDMWDDAVKQKGKHWRMFYTHFTNVLQGSMMLVTTRSSKVAHVVGTMQPFPLQGLKDDDYWKFFKQCVSVSDICQSHPELERIGRSILPKLQGSPLAAETLGQLLGMNLDPAHWNSILQSELWELRQEETDILPALRLSYMYLPFHLKRCFSFCAVYPKGHKFEKASLADIWVAEGFVVPQGNIPLHDIGCQYFEDLVNRSFFQKLRGTFVIHDLMHDMAQLVSKDECFIIRNESDFQKVPQNVRHLSISKNSDITCSNLLDLRKHTKLRTLLCNKSLGNKDATSVLDLWCGKLQSMRVLFCASVRFIPDSISNMKHLRYLEVSRACPFKSLPSALCCLYNLQILYARKCNLECLPSDFSKLINLQRFESELLQYHRDQVMEIDAAAVEGQEQKIRLLKNLNQFRGHLIISNLSAVSKDLVTEAELENKEYLNSLTLGWSSLRSPEHNEIEVLEALHPPTNLKSLHLKDYPGESIPRFHQRSLPTTDNNIDIAGSIFSSLTELTIEGCQNLSTLDHFLQPDYVPVIKKIELENCRRLVSLCTAGFGNFHFIEELKVYDCPKLNISPSLQSRSLKTLELKESGNLSDKIKCPSLAYLYLSSSHLESIQLQMWSLPVLRELYIGDCKSLQYIHVSCSFSSLTRVTIIDCETLISLDHLLKHEYVSAIEIIYVSCCKELTSLDGGQFGSFPRLKDLNIWDCPRLNWQRGMVLPSSLKKLSLQNCGDFSAWFPNCLENLTSLESLELFSCEHIVSIPGELWRNNLISLQDLWIRDCPKLRSIGGRNATESIENVQIEDCPKLRD